MHHSSSYPKRTNWTIILLGTSWTRTERLAGPIKSSSNWSQRILHRKQRYRSSVVIQKAFLLAPTVDKTTRMISLNYLSVMRMMLELMTWHKRSTRTQKAKTTATCSRGRLLNSTSKLSTAITKTKEYFYTSAKKTRNIENIINIACLTIQESYTLTTQRRIFHLWETA